MHNLPRRINPELIEPGDVIVVKLDDGNGVTMRRSGTVATTGDPESPLRFFETAEGGTLFAWEVGSNNSHLHITLLARAEPEQSPLFTLTAESMVDTWKP